MDGLLTRKQFFREIACKTAQFTIDLIEPQTTAAATDQNAAALAADLTPELLELEAKRLGLDPSDHQQVLEHLSRSLQRSGT